MADKPLQNRHFLTALVLLILSQLVFTSCQDSGDETISLEFGSPKKMIIGQWRITGVQNNPGAITFAFSGWKEGTLLSFYNDGTYTDSSDGGDTRHIWRLGTDADDVPYTGGIDLDRYGFGIGSLGPGGWVLEYPRGSGGNDVPGWVIGLDKENDDPDGTSMEPDSQPSKYGYRVNKVERYWASTSPSETYTISYGNNGTPNGITTPRGSYNWTIAKNTLTLLDAKTRKTLKTCTLNSNSQYIVREVGADASANGYTAVMEYGGNGYLRTMNCNINNVDETWTFSDEGGYSLSIKETLGSNSWASIFSYHFNGDNDSNIDLNPFIKTLLRDVYLNDVLSPFGFYGQRYPLIASELLSNADYYLDNTKVSRNEQGLISEITMDIIFRNTNEHGGKLRVLVYYEKYEE